MIYITLIYCDLTQTSSIKNVWEVKFSNVKELYKNFLLEKAKEKNIVINEQWYNMMAKEMYHDYFTEIEYVAKRKDWDKFLRQWNIDKFISEKLKGKKLKYDCL